MADDQTKNKDQGEKTNDEDTGQKGGQTTSEDVDFDNDMDLGETEDYEE